MATNRRKLTGDADFQRLVICQMLKAARMGRGETIVQVGEATGISPSTVTLLENGHRDPSLGTVLMLADHYGLQLDLVAGQRDEPEDESTRA